MFIAGKYSWHLGERHPFYKPEESMDECYSFVDKRLENVDSIMADGDEYSYVIHSMPNVRSCTLRSYCTWYGDEAKFIIRNLPSR
jgi:hypothetical protein